MTEDSQDDPGTDDDRLDRAERIRRMREGRTADTGSDAADGGDADPDDDTVDGSDAGPSDGSDGVGNGDAPDESSHENSSDEPVQEGSPDESGQEETPVEADPATVEKDDLPAAVDDTASETAAEGDLEDAAEPSTDVEDTLGETESESGDTQETTAEGEASPDDPEAEADDDETAERDEDAEEEAGSRDEGPKLLEFDLGDERYGFDVTYVDEIVEEQDIARMPNTPNCVEGLIDLRGRVTTVLDPTEVLDPPGDPAEERLIVVFDQSMLEDQGSVGWLVDDVDQVATITDAEVTEPPEDHGWMQGVIKHDDREEYVVWITPELVFDRTREVIQGETFETEA